MCFHSNYQAVVKLNNSPPVPALNSRVNLVILSSDEHYVRRMTECLGGNDLFHIAHIDSLYDLRRHQQPVDIVMAEIDADQADSLMLPCWVGELSASGLLCRIPHIVWTLQSATPGSATLVSHADLASRALGNKIEIVAGNHPAQLRQALEALAGTPTLPHALQPASLLSEEDVVSVMSTGDGLRVVLQPQYNLASRRVVGAEALVRWRHPLYGEVPPSKLISMVGLLGLDLLLFSHIQKAVIRFLGVLDRLGVDIPLTVNASARTLCAAGLASRLAARMHQAGLPARRLKIELSEAVSPGNELALSASITALRAKGFLISLGDFGAGTLDLLAQIPFDEMKIGGKLLRVVGQAPRSSEIIAGIANLARLFGLGLVIEGIEDPDSVELLERLGCSTGQGFALAHPLEQDDFLGLVIND